MLSPNNAKNWFYVGGATLLLALALLLFGQSSVGMSLLGAAMGVLAAGTVRLIGQRGRDNPE